MENVRRPENENPLPLQLADQKLALTFAAEGSVQNLERELRHKDKALAEKAALLALRN